VELKNICIIADGYPSEYFVVNAFVETLVNEMTDQGVNCTVIAPQSITNSLVYHRKTLPFRRERTTAGGNRVVIYTPWYISLSAKKMGRINTSEAGLASFRRACEKVFRRLEKETQFDAVYGHFIFPAGITANYLGQKYGIPAFFAYGENTTYTMDYLGDEKTRRLLSGIRGVVAVSGENKRVLTEHRMAEEGRIGVFPNSVDRGLFYPRDRETCRKKLGLPAKTFTVIFVGRFLDVKGPDRVCEALKKLGGGINAIFIGAGSLKPDYAGTVFCGEVQHEALPEYLSAADVFVLPTKAEGCCNAIIEAMACGLPIVSSDLPFNEDILDRQCAALIDPRDTEAIASAIRTLKEDTALREKLAAAALQRAAGLDISVRAAQIIRFIQSVG